MSQDVQTIGAKPVGLKGFLAGVVMNLIHSGQYRKIINRHVRDKFRPQDAISILDIGCGGGKAMHLFRSVFPNATVCGIDHSPDMVALAKKINRRDVDNGNVEVCQGDVEAICFSDASLDVVAAFDTINFWPNVEKAMVEIFRVLKEGGMLLVVNGYPKEGTKWWDFVKLKSDDEYRKALNKSGYKDISVEIDKNTIIVTARR